MMKLKNSELLRSQCYINGKWLDAENKGTFSVHNPSNGHIVGKVPSMGANETKEAIDTAYQAFHLWREKTPKERSLFLKIWHALILENLDDLAAIMTMEQGKVLSESKNEIHYGANFIEWFAEEAKRVYGDIIPSIKQDQRYIVIKQPIGVVGAITPWNFPMAMIARKCAPALAAGCSIIIKPAKATPFSALALGFLAEKAGLPKGVLNIITGDAKSIGEELTTNPKVKKITFTGSTEVGKLLMKQASSTVKKISLELGGNAPFIIFSDANIEKAIEGLILSKFRNSGQTCICANRIFVQDEIYDSFAKKFIEKVKTLKVGDGFDPNSHIGPLINQDAIQKVETHIADALKKGAIVGCGGKRSPLGQCFFEPTVLTEIKDTMLIAKEEIFGPLAPLIRFKNENEVVAMANNTTYGLASYFYSQDINRVIRVAENLEFGMVSVNGGLFSNEVAPFGGVKESGIGREGSKYGIEEYVEIKYVCVTTY